MRLHKKMVPLICISLVLALIGGSAGHMDSLAEDGTSQINSPPANVAKYQSKSEVVYANLSDNGSLTDVYVVNEFYVSDAGQLTDFGVYSDLTNLSTDENIVKDNDRISVSVKPGQFYYQGTLNNPELPWMFNLSYSLDGKGINASDLSGKDGKLEIKLTSEKNPSIDPIFYDNYMLQITLRLDSEKCRNIDSKGATIASEGKNKTIVHTVLKGKDANILIAADVTDFSMDGFEIAAMPFKMDFESPKTDELTSEMTTLSDAISSLNDGVGKLASGSSELSNGLSNMVGGSSEFSKGLTSLSGTSGKLTGGSAQIKVALDQIAQSMSTTDGDMDFADLAQLPTGLRQMALGIQGFSEGLGQLKDGYSSLLSTLDAAIMSIPNGTVSDDDITDLYSALSDPGQEETLRKLIEGYAASQLVKQTYVTVGSSGMSVQDGMYSVLNSLSEIILGDGTQSNPGLNGMVTALNALANAIENGFDANEIMSQMKQLTDGLIALASQYSDFHNGLVKYTGGVDQVATEYIKLHGGMVSLNGGTRELSNGISELYSGTTELSNELANLPETMQVEIDNLMKDYTGTDFIPASFVSKKNTNIALVQFVVMSSKVEEVNNEEKKVTEQSSKKETPWVRFLDLFR